MDYENQLDSLRVALGQAMLELAVARPSDPVAFLANALLRLRPSCVGDPQVSTEKRA
uniref:DUF2783 domain-containing protein n=1 Tax=Macrostomum lignano TaxID=282301 RepID=A0A1I8GQD6_9PLAT